MTKIVIVAKKVIISIYLCKLCLFLKMIFKSILMIYYLLQILSCWYDYKKETLPGIVGQMDLGAQGYW